MHSRCNSLFFVLIISLLAVPCFSAESSETEQGIAGAVVSFPYWAEITGDNVYVRSGAGTNYYRCGKLQAGEEVKVVSQKYSWSQIVPPAGSFSWIAKDYVQADAANASIATVTGDNVRVWAGSPHLKPLYSTTMQGKLNKGEKVKLLGEEMGDYYKIEPPAFAYLWVSTQFTKLVKTAEPVEVAVPVSEDEVAASDEEAVSPADDEAEVEDVDDSATINVTDTNDSNNVSNPEFQLPEPKHADFTLEAQLLTKYHEVEAKIEAEHAKAVEERNFEDIKKELSEIITHEDAGKAGRYAEFALNQISRYELARKVSGEVEAQDEELDKIRDEIEKEKQQRLEKIDDLGAFAVIGTFESSKVFEGKVNKRYYRIVGENNRTVCYAVPTPLAESLDLEKFLGKKVGLMGTIKPNPDTSGALVEFSDIKAID